MKGKMIDDWGKVDLVTLGGQRSFLDAVQYFMDRPRVASEEIRARMQEGDPRNPPIDGADAIARYHGVGDIDTGWMKLFDVIDFTGTRKNNFDMIDVSRGHSFRAIMPGEKAKIYKTSGEKVQVNFDLYGGALGWSRLWFDDDEWWKIEDTTQEFRLRWYANKDQAHYDLISSARCDHDLRWLGESPQCLDGWRDILTINEACQNIIDDMQNLGFDINASAGFVVLCPVQLFGRLRDSLYMFKSNFNVRLVVTTRLRTQDLSYPETSQYFVALPGRKMKSGNRMDLNVLSEDNVLAYAETVAGWGRYGAIIGESKQLRRCATE